METDTSISPFGGGVKVEGRLQPKHS